MLDLMKIAITESEGGDLEACIGQLLPKNRCKAKWLSKRNSLERWET